MSLGKIKFVFDQDFYPGGMDIMFITPNVGVTYGRFPYVKKGESRSSWSQELLLAEHELSEHLSRMAGAYAGTPGSAESADGFRPAIRGTRGGISRSVNELIKDAQRSASRGWEVEENLLRQVDEMVSLAERIESLL